MQAERTPQTEVLAPQEAQQSLFWSKAWYFCSFSTSGLLQPLLNLYFKRSGLSEAQIGVITAMRPWTSAVADYNTGNLWASLGDHTGAYKIILLVAHTSAVATRYCIGLAGSFPLILTLVIVAEAMTAPLQILADASAMAAGTEENYGKARLWGAIGWGACSPLSGVIVSRFGEKASFNANLIGGIIGFLPTLLLPTDSLKAKKMEGLKPKKLTAFGDGKDTAYQEPLLADVKLDPEAQLRDAGLGPSPGKDNKASSSADTSYASSSDKGDERQLSTSLDNQGGSKAEDSTLLTQPDSSELQGGHPHFSHHRASHQNGAFDASPSGKKMRRGDSFLFEVADTIPLVPAPDFVEYESALIHPHERHRHSSEGRRHSTERPHHSLEHHCLDEEAASVSKSSEADSVYDELHDMTLWQKLALLFSDLELIIFLIMAVLFGFATGCIDGYLFLYLDSLGGPEVLMGLTITVSCVIELPIFHYMGQILQLVGVQPMLHWVMFFFLIRLLCYSLLAIAPSPWLVLPVESLNAITFGCAWAAGTVQCSRSAPPGLEATTQSIYAGLYGGLGRGLGGLFGGLVYGRYGPRSTFVATLSVMCVGWAICASAQQVIRRCHSRKELQVSEPFLAGSS